MMVYLFSLGGSVLWKHRTFGNLSNHLSLSHIPSGQSASSLCSSIRLLWSKPACSLLLSSGRRQPLWHLRRLLRPRLRWQAHIPKLRELPIWSQCRLLQRSAKSINFNLDYHGVLGVDHLGRARASTLTSEFCQNKPRPTVILTHKTYSEWLSKKKTIIPCKLEYFSIFSVLWTIIWYPFVFFRDGH